MYYPYLRGRQFELIALREFAAEYSNNINIIPIIEPVKRTFNSMKLAISKFIENNLRFALILNPQVGELENKIIRVKTELKDELTDSSKWIPAFIVTNDIKNITRCIIECNYSDVMIICSELTDISSDDFNNLILLPNIKYIVSQENRLLKRNLRGKGKHIIRLDDNFKAQKRNSDYLDMPEDKFSEEHLFYKEDGYYGFSDYTLLEKDFKEGGAAPYAVAIHLSYQKKSEDIWVKHFTSITNFDRSNIQGKFSEAAKKAVNFLDNNNIHNQATNELRKYYTEKKYPGLGMIKKISIKNHIELVNKIIDKSS